MPVLIFMRDLVVATFGQMASLFAGIFIFGLLINIISRLTMRSLEKSFGRTGVYSVAWLGTPVHELGHIIFCLIFLHKIVEVKFFEPDPATGTLGYVSHSWNRSNPWQVLGNLFIGIGPVILGCLVLLAIFYLLIPDSQQAWESISRSIGQAEGDHSIVSYGAILLDSMLSMARLIFIPSNLISWKFWLFCYLSICVASNIKLSLADIRGSFSGLGYFILIFLIINLVSLLVGFDSGEMFSFAAGFLGTVYSLFIVAIIMTLWGFFLTYIISAVYYRITTNRILNPF